MSEAYELKEKIKDFLEIRDFKSLKNYLLEQNPVDIAEVMDDFGDKEFSLCFRLLPKELAAEAFVNMDSDRQKLLIDGLSDAKLKEILDEICPDDAADLVGEMPAGVVSRILKHTDPEMRDAINAILRYPKNSVGSIMTTEYVSLRRNMTVAEAIAKIRRVGVDKETVYTCYVTEQRKLVGVISVRAILVAQDDEILENLMTTECISVLTTDDREAAVEKIGKYGFLAIPVLDTEERIVGIVTVDDAMDVMETEASEDIAQMAAILPSEKPYLKTSAFRLWLSRVPWLLLLMISATLTSRIISSYETALAACAVLTAFIPMIMGTGGNAGGQASVTIIRGLSLDEIRLSDTLWVVWKELRVSLLCGLTLAPFAFLKVMYLDGLWREPDGVRISLIVSATLFLVVVAAKLVGCLLPLLVKAVRLDPAVVANPFITTVVDALALVVYFALASRLVPALAAGALPV
ncbi:MAG: magnesium transporter [Clostridia bacterium]|nr:magnesium transporter [Clostridia bacterium]